MMLIDEEDHVVGLSTADLCFICVEIFEHKISWQQFGKHQSVNSDAVC